MVFTLLFLVIILTSGAGEKPLVDNSGFLQTLWLSHQHSDIKALMTDIPKPSDKELREKGMTTTVRLAAKVREDGTGSESIGLVQKKFSTFDDSESSGQ
jgi:hypothetical protein